MKYLEDFKIKHLAAFVGNEVGKSVDITGIGIDPELYATDNLKLTFQYCAIEYKERKPDAAPETARFVWYCDSEDLEIIEGLKEEEMFKVKPLDDLLHNS